MAQLIYLEGHDCFLMFIMSEEHKTYVVKWLVMEFLSAFFLSFIIFTMVIFSSIIFLQS